MENRIREICKQKGMKMSDLALKIGMGQSNLVASIRKNPKLSTLEDVCKGLDIELCELFADTAENSEQKTIGTLYIDGKTYSISEDNSVLKLPTYNDLSLLKKDVKGFMKEALDLMSNNAFCGILFNKSFIHLLYDKENKIFHLTTFAQNQMYTRPFEIMEYESDENIWDFNEIYNDIMAHIGY